MQTSPSPSYALVTGASSGIGLEIAKQLAQRGYNLILVARSVDTLNKLSDDLIREYPNILVMVIPCDLSQTGSASHLFERVQELKLDVEILVNNAGFGMSGRFEELPLNRQLEMIHLNMVSLTELMYFFLPVLKGRKKGYILNTASTAGLMPSGPYMSLYFATKAYVVSLSLGVREELKGTGVSVTALCPGATNTGFFGTEVNNSLGNWAKGHSPVTVATASLKALFAKKAFVVPGLSNKIVFSLVPFLPKSWISVITASLLKK
jgi:short-subunit dehydrogenase